MYKISVIWFAMSKGYMINRRAAVQTFVTDNRNVTRKTLVV